MVRKVEFPITSTSVSIGVRQIKLLDMLIDNGILSFRSEGIRQALDDWLPKKILQMEIISKTVEAYEERKKEIIIDGKRIRIIGEA